MRAIEYGLLHNGNYSYKDIRQNIYAFNEKIVVSDEENTQEQPSYTEIVYAQVEEIQDEFNAFRVIKNGQIIDVIEGNYLLNSSATTVSEIAETATVYLNISSITAPVYKFGEEYFTLITRVNVGDVEWSFLLENVKVEAPFFTHKKREKITLLNDILKEKKLSVIVFVSKDGALLETAYQTIDSLYPNEIVLFIETNDKANMFGSVVRIKTGENVDSTSGVPYKKLSKIVDYFEAKIDSSSLLEIIKEHVIDKSSNLFLVKKTLWGVFDKVVTLSSGLALETIQRVSEGIAEVINVFKIDDSRWMYYDEQGKPLKEHNLFLPGIENILALQETNKSHPQLDTSKTNSEAISKITALENALKSQRKNLGKATFFKKIIDQLLYMLSRVKDFLKDPLQQPLEAIETSFVIYNAFIVGLINSIVDAIKGIFDMIALICQGLIALKDKAIDMAQNLTSYFSLLFEMIENQIETLTNIFSKENLNALFAFFKKCGILALTLPAKLFSWISEGVEMPNLDKVAYYMGYLIGFIIQLILEILFTGGAKTVADAFAKLAESLMALFKTLKTVAFKLKKGAVIAFENLLSIFAYIREKSKNLKTFLDELWEIIQGWFKKGKADEVFEGAMRFPIKLVLGKYSKRTFDINNCGGKILNLTWENAKITKEGIEIVKRHLSRFEYDDWNARMIERLHKILKNELQISDFDKRFFTHETREFERYKALGHERTSFLDLPEEEFGKLWENTHSATLEDYRIFEKIKYDDSEVYSLYHPSVQF